ncbi:MAG: di-heme oxidoredictase family protein, partial [Pseudomonadota bacterium]
SEARQPLSYDLAELPEVKALPRDAKGRVLVPLFGDLRRHTMVDRTVDTFGNELLAQRFVARHDFQTTELWGVGQTAPYGHRGDLTTLDAAIRAHGGDARASRDKFIALGANDRSAIIAFLKTLVIRP